MPRQQHNDPEAQQPLQVVPRPQYGSSSVNNPSSSSPMQKAARHSHHYYGFHFAHFALFLPTVLHFLTPLLLFAVMRMGHVPDYAYYCCYGAYFFFWGWGGVTFLMYSIETIIRCCNRNHQPSPRAHAATTPSLTWHYVKFTAHLLIAIVFGIWTATSAHYWLKKDMPEDNYLIVLMCALQVVWVSISAVLEFILIRRVHKERAEILAWNESQLHSEISVGSYPY